LDQHANAFRVEAAGAGYSDEHKTSLHPESSKPGGIGTRNKLKEPRTNPEYGAGRPVPTVKKQEKDRINLLSSTVQIRKWIQRTGFDGTVKARPKAPP
jgi:hypothetical protein